MSNPLAAISVATKTWILFALNLAITWFLLFCLKFPCKESDSNPSFSKFLANFLHYVLSSQILAWIRVLFLLAQLKYCIYLLVLS